MMVAVKQSAIVAACCAALSFLLASSAPHQLNLQESAQQYVQQPQLTLPLLPRKLNLQEVTNVKSSADKDILLHKKLLEASAGDKKVEKEEHDMINHARKRGTWREWVESPNKSEYFTMDYAWVRRRRPIHNKQISFVP